MSKTAVGVVGWLVVLAMPFFLGFSTIRLYVNNADWYVGYEYDKEAFPADLYWFTEPQQVATGLRPFTQAEREELALVAVDYLQRSEPAEEVIYLLEEQRLPDTDRSLYNPSEISHMIDVKHLTDAIARLNWLAAALVIGGLAFLLWRPATRPVAYRALFYGGLATTALLLLIGLFIVVGWSVFFVQFHELLFPPGTWTFSYSDSLIRLFPEKFWFDFGTLVSGTALFLGVLTTIVGYVLWRQARLA